MTDWNSILKSVEESEAKRREAIYPGLPEGFTISPLKRCGEIYYRQSERILEIPWELSGVKDYDILILPLNIEQWTQPNNEAITSNERTEIISELELWLKTQNIKADAFAPPHRHLLEHS